MRGSMAWSQIWRANPSPTTPARSKRPQRVECDIAIANTYYLARLLQSDDAQDRAVGEAIGVIMPNQGDRGTHINVSGVGVMKNAPNRDNAVRFIEFWSATTFSASLPRAPTSGRWSTRSRTRRFWTCSMATSSRTT